jgi:hypothetical protein
MRFKFHQHLTESLGRRQSARFHTLRLRATLPNGASVGAALRRLLSEFGRCFSNWLIRQTEQYQIFSKYL